MAQMSLVDKEPAGCGRDVNAFDFAEDMGLHMACPELQRLYLALLDVDHNVRRVEATVFFVEDKARNRL